MLLFSGVMKLLKPAPVVEEFSRLGYPERLAIVLGIIELGCTVVYVIPRTAVLGAILLTAYPFFFPIIVGILVWLGLYFRDPRLRPLMPLTKR